MEFIFLLYSFIGMLTLHQIQCGSHIVEREFDCVEIYKQPALSHPLLKNHKIQMKPTDTKQNAMHSNNLSHIKHLKNSIQGCARGMVPILKDQGNVNDQPLQNMQSDSHIAGMESAGSFRGVAAQISVHNPTVTLDSQVSGSQIWVMNKDPNERNSIQAGWAVHPQLYGDNQTRVTAYWTTDGFKRTGCYNLKCPGFVQTNPKFYLGFPFEQKQISTTDGPIYFTYTYISQDFQTGNWWLYTDYETFGYWPSELFKLLKKEAQIIRYGGWTLPSSNGVSPMMGTGKWPTGKGLNGAAAFIYLQYRGNDGYWDITPEQQLKQFLTGGPTCYNSNYIGIINSTLQGGVFTYGGQGGRCHT